MKTVAVISEYNPFHMGHAYQFQKIRESFGEDTVIIAIMSGNFVQRGTPAILGKFERARMAVLCGASLVLELPFPFCAASAEYFAAAGVSLANDLSVVDVLSFGSESGSTEALIAAADKLQDPDFLKLFKTKLGSKEEKGKGYPHLLFETFRAYYGEDFPLSIDLPNNTLAISYISALKKCNSHIRPHTVLRKGTDALGASEEHPAGATYVRSLFYEGKTGEAFSHIPPVLHDLWRDAIASGLAPAKDAFFARAMLAHLRYAPMPDPLPLDCGGGVLSLLKKHALEARDLDELFSLASNKKHTQAHLRRASLFSYLGVTPASIKAKPLYTQVLAMDPKGQRLLAHIRKTANISLLTKPADLHKLSSEARAQAELSYRADSVYTLCTPVPQKANIFLRTAPYRE